jgi:hypothetical protein
MNSHQGHDLLAQKKPPAPQWDWRYFNTGKSSVFTSCR